MAPQSRARAALAIAAGVLLAGVAGGIAFPILPIVGVQSGLALPFIGVILAANRAMRVVSSPIVGVISDRYGGRRTLIVGLGFQILVMLLYTLGVTTRHAGAFFLAGRMLHGPGSACVFVAGQALALHAGGRTHGGRAAASVRAAMSLGVPIGLVAGAVVSDRWGNVRTFETALGGVVIATIVAWWLVPDLRVEVPKLSGLGKTLEAFRDRRLLAIGAFNFAVAFSVQGMVLTTLSLVVRTQRLSLLGFGDVGSSGILMGVLVVTSALVMPLAGRLGDRGGLHVPIALGGLVALVPSFVIIGFAPTKLGLLAGLAIMGLAAGVLGPSLLAMVGSSVDQQRRGVAVGVLQLCGDVGGTLGPLAGTALFTDGVRTLYIVTAVVVACFVPFGARLLRTAVSVRPPETR